MNAVIYARYSSDNQREESIEGQLRECMEFAKRKGYTVVKTYADRAISGKRADNRPEFQQMISDSATGEFDTIIVWKIDRFSRDKYDSVMYKFRLNKNGVSVISATEPIDNSPEGKLMESIFEGFSEYYIKELAMKTSRGMTENAIKGKFNGGNITFGYIIDKDKHFCIDPVNAPIVADIFARYADGEPIRSIVDSLNSKGVLINGKKFTYHSINWLLKNRRYLGEYTFGDIINNDAIPPIVSLDLFEKCQKRLSLNKHSCAHFKKVEETYFLTGKIFCGNCGGTMSGISGTSKCSAIYRYYQCMLSKKKRCYKKNISKETIENIVFSSVMNIFDDKQLVKRISTACVELQTRENPALSAMKKRLSECKKEEENVLTAIKKGILTKSTKSALEKLESEQEKLEEEISREKIRRPVLKKEQIESWILRFAKTNLSDPTAKQRLIDAFVNSVFVYDDKVVILLNFKDGERTVNLDEIDSLTEKANTPSSECSPSVKFGDPYGN